jgi:hypothetical protein
VIWAVAQADLQVADVPLGGHMPMHGSCLAAVQVDGDPEHELKPGSLVKPYHI